MSGGLLRARLACQSGEVAEEEETLSDEDGEQSGGTVDGGKVRCPRAWRKGKGEIGRLQPRSDYASQRAARAESGKCGDAVAG